MSGDVDLSSFNWGNYGLVVIDESHNFRNNTRGKRDEDGNRITRSRYERLMEDIVKSGVNTKMAPTFRDAGETMTYEICGTNSIF